MATVIAQAKFCKARHFKHVRDLVDEIHRLGGAQVRVSVTGGGHVRIDWCIGIHSRFVFLAHSPSDRRAGLNDRAFVRRQFRGVS
jgi:hypothetical protein